MALGVISLGVDGGILDLNDEARRILDERDGIVLTPAGLSSDSLQTRRDLNRLLEQALKKNDANTPGVVDAMPIVRPSGRSRLAVLVKPVPAGSWPDHRNRPAAMLFIRDPEANAPSGAPALARRLLGLTSVEEGRVGKEGGRKSKTRGDTDLQ